MQIKNDLNTEKLNPKLTNFDIFSIKKLDIKMLQGDIDLIKEAEKNWQELQEFEFQKMDVKDSFEKLIKKDHLSL